MKLHMFLLFFFAQGILQSTFCMGTELDCVVSKRQLRPWNEKVARSGSLVAYEDGIKFRCARLHEKDRRQAL